MNKLIAVFGLCILMLGCYPIEEPQRPVGVPDSAVWFGGPDGGLWYDCVTDAKRNGNICSVYDDGDGSLLIKAMYQIIGENRAASADELNSGLSLEYFSEPGTIIKLGSGKSLEQIEVIYINPEWY